MPADSRTLIVGTLCALAAGLIWGLVFVAPTMLVDYPPVLLSVSRPARRPALPPSAAPAWWCRTLQVLDAADVGADDGLRLQRRQVAELAVAQLRAPAWAAARCRCRPSRSTGGFRCRQADFEAQRAQVLSTPPRSCWPCCSVHGG
jgi:hypothetical protein